MNQIDSNRTPVSQKSPFREFLGMHIVELSADHAVMELTIEAHHLNSQGTLHGGILATLVDNSGGVAGCYCHRTGTMRKAVTLSLTTSFLAPVSSGTVRAVSRKRSAGRTIFTATTDLFDDNGKLLAIGEATYRYFPERQE